MPDFLALLWRPGRLRLLGLTVGAPAGPRAVELWSGRAHGAYGTGRYDVALAQAGSQVLLTCPGVSLSTPVLRSLDGGRSFALVPPVPAGVSGLLGRYQPHPDGSITLLETRSLLPPPERDDSQRVHRLASGAAAWRSLELPATFDAWNLATTPTGELLVAGAWHRRDGRRAALLSIGACGQRLIEPTDERRAAWVRRVQGWLWPCAAAEPFMRVDAAEEPWLLARETGGYESSSVLITLVTAGRWRTCWLPRDACAWLRPRTGHVRLVTSTGRLLDTADAGKTWTRRNLMRPVRALVPAPSKDELSVSSAAQRGDDLVLLVTVHDWSREELQTLRETVLLHTADAGRTTRELLRTQGPDEAVAAVVPAPRA